MLPKNLLPNASFELDFGDSVPTNWGDTQNELTLQLHLDLNPDEIGITQVPQVPPRSEAMDETVDGERAARNDGPLKLSLTTYNHIDKAVNEPITCTNLMIADTIPGWIDDTPIHFS